VHLSFASVVVSSRVVVLFFLPLVLLNLRDKKEWKERQTTLFLQHAIVVLPMYKHRKIS
jgi:amino acid transporter